MHMGEGPAYSVQSKAPRDSRVFVHILVIIVVDELMPERLTEDDPDHGHEEKTNKAVAALRLRMRVGTLDGAASSSAPTS